jgi:glycosyltransferase involved in cell wall biosynthesis
MRDPSRILYISHTSPVPAKIGPSRRHYHILDQLARFYDVHLLSLGTPSEEEMFREAFKYRVPDFDYSAVRHGKEVRFMQKVWRTLTWRCDFLPVLEPNLHRLLAEVTSRQQFDAIMLSTPLLFGLPLPRGVPIVSDTHNVESDVLKRTSVLAETFLRRQYARRQARFTFREERRCSHGVDLLLANSDRDRQVFESEFDVRNIAVIPNGIDLTEFSPPKSLGDLGIILFTGLMSYYPNQQAVRWFLSEAFPLILKKMPEAKLVIAGARPPAWLLNKRSNVLEVTDTVPDMRPYFERACVVIAPLMIGGGTRVKILEAQAMARPVVSTTLGAEGIDGRHGHTILLADEPTSFAMHVCRLLTDLDFAAEIGANGREHVARFYDWNRIGEHLEATLRERIGLVSRETAGAV